MAAAPPSQIAVATPTGPLFDLVLLLHVACVGFGLFTLVAGAAQAAKLASSADPIPDGLRRYYAPGTNWLARTIHGVPVFGFVLIAISHRAYSLSDAWVMLGLAAWVLAAMVLESYCLPTEKRIAAAIAAPDATVNDDQRAEASRLALVDTALTVLVIAAVVVMVAQP